jgi:hypothetical protein
MGHRMMQLLDFSKLFFFYLCKGWQTMGDLLGIFWALSFNFGGLGVEKWKVKISMHEQFSGDGLCVTKKWKPNI